MQPVRDWLSVLMTMFRTAFLLVFMAILLYMSMALYQHLCH